MALRKAIDFKGYTPEYWVIVRKLHDKITDTTQVVAVCYKNRIARDADIKNFIPGVEGKATFAGDLSMAECYVELKKTEFFTDAIDE